MKCRKVSHFFLVYAFLAGVIVKKALLPGVDFLTYDAFKSTFGAPVRIFRALCAVVACLRHYSYIAYNLDGKPGRPFAKASNAAVRLLHQHRLFYLFRMPILL